MVSTMTDKDIWRLNRGGHDPHKVYAAYHKAMENRGSPSVIITKTIKGLSMNPNDNSKVEEEVRNEVVSLCSSFPIYKNLYK